MYQAYYTMSISSTLIRSCMTNIHREFSQLEHWLNSLEYTKNMKNVPTSTESRSEPNNDIKQTIEQLTKTSSELVSSLEKLTERFDAQQMALIHIVNRLDILEGSRDIHLDEPNPWSDSGTFENEIIEPTDTIYVHKEDDTPMESTISVEPEVQPPVVQAQPLVVQAQPPVVQAQPPVVQAQPPVVQAQPPAAKPVEPVSAPVVVAPVEPVKPAEPVAQEEEEVEEQEEQEEEQEEQEEAEEDEDEELIETPFKGKTYYRTTEDFVYGMDDEGNLTEQPIGIWKEKTQTISFYRLK
jgi:hypothetical protein